jgi:hypothetical protein
MWCSSNGFARWVVTMTADDGVEVEETDKGWRWVVQTEGGACFVAPRLYKTRAAARRAGRAWAVEHEKGTG